MVQLVLKQRERREIMLNKLFQGSLNWVYKTFKNDTSKMLIATGSLGWILSSIAQAGAVLGNSKLSSEKKSFLLPQELMDGAINAIAFIGITLFAKKGIEKMASTGKIAPESVRKFLNDHSVYKNKVGKLDFNLDYFLPKDSEVFKSYESYKNFVTTMGTVGASVLSCNIVTPLLRNATASRVQKTYIDMKNNPSAYQYNNNSGMRI